MATAEQPPRLTIRPARLEDAPALREIFNDAVEDGLATFDSTLRSIDEQKDLIAAAEEDSRRPLLVAEVRNWVCGVVSIEPHEQELHSGEVGEVTVFVRRSFRSYGVGRQLMRVAQTEAAGLDIASLSVAFWRITRRACNYAGRRVGAWLALHEQHARHGSRLRDVALVEFLLPAVPRPNDGPPAREKLE